MSPTKTYSVESAYVGHDKQPRCYVRVDRKDRTNAGPYLTDQLLSEGDAVVINGGRAERAQ